MRRRALALAAVLWCVATPARADLIDLGDGLIYDSEQDLTWMQDVLFPRTLGLDSDGHWGANDGLFGRYWGDDALRAVVDSVSYAGSDGWRLPYYFGTGIHGYGDSEVSRVLRGLGWHWEAPDPFSFPSYQPGGSGPFQNVGYPAYLTSESGLLIRWWSAYYDVDFAEDGGALWLVHDGKVDPNHTARVPEPSTTLIVGVGLASLGFRRLRRRTASVKVDVRRSK